jgi:anti-sigma factor RsiW
VEIHGLHVEPFPQALLAEVVNHSNESKAAKRVVCESSSRRPLRAVFLPAGAEIGPDGWPPHGLVASFEARVSRLLAALRMV